jgi:hypothetical protein
MIKDRIPAVIVYEGLQGFKEVTYPDDLLTGIPLNGGLGRLKMEVV